MRDSNAYPELILASAQDKMRELAHKQARQEARRAAKAASRGSRSGSWPWWRRRGTRSPEPGD